MPSGWFCVPQLSLKSIPTSVLHTASHQPSLFPLCGPLSLTTIIPNSLLAFPLHLMNELGVSGTGREEMTPLSGETGKETILFKEEPRRDTRRHRLGSKPACNPELILIASYCVVLIISDYSRALNIREFQKLDTKEGLVSS